MRYSYNHFQRIDSLRAQQTQFVNDYNYCIVYNLMGMFFQLHEVFPFLKKYQREDDNLAQLLFRRSPPHIQYTGSG